MDTQTKEIGYDGHLNGIDKCIIELARVSMVDKDKFSVVFKGGSSAKYTATCHEIDGCFLTVVKKNDNKIAVITRNLANDDEEVVQFVKDKGD